MGAKRGCAPLRLVNTGVVLALVAMASACGGSSESTISKAQFIKRADAICEKTNKVQLAAMEKAAKLTEKTLGVKIEQLSEKQQEEAVVGAVLPAVPREVEELEALPLPEGSEEEAEQIIQGIAGAAREVKPGDRIDELEETFAAINKRLAKFGFKRCTAAP